VVPHEEPSGPYLEAIQRAFRYAREQRHGCGPADFLVGISQGQGPAAAALDPGGGRPFLAVGGRNAGYLHMQAQEAARRLAAGRGQPLGPEHLLVALLDQGTPEVLETLARAGLTASAVRQAALAGIGAPAGLPPLPMPLLTPAGTLDREPLPVADLNVRAWAVLRWRQDHLPLDQLRGPRDLAALSHLERSAAWQVADRLDLDDDQRYSLAGRHADAVERLAAQERPDLARGGPPPRRRGRPHVLAGWATWLGNRRTGLHNRWFRVRTMRSYRGCPRP
jgi:hypothetical protein